MLKAMFYFMIITKLLNPSISMYQINEEAYNNYIIPYVNEIEAKEEFETEEIKKPEDVKQENTVVAGDLGIFSVPSACIKVGLYSDGNAFQQKGKASVQYYIQYGVCWIADHVNQDNFNNLKNVAIGSDVYINETHYVVTENIYYSDYYSNFYGCGALDKIGEYSSYGGLAVQTCEGDGARLMLCTPQ